LKYFGSILFFKFSNDIKFINPFLFLLTKKQTRPKDAEIMI
jgi:hypothetical protein